MWTEAGWINDVIYFDGTTWHRMDPTFASANGSSSAIMDYIGNGSNYTVKYLYYKLTGLEYDDDESNFA